MSYYIWLEHKTICPNCAESWTYTSNCAPMWRRAGADLADFHGKKVKHCIPKLERAIQEMKVNLDVYTNMDPENGWGLASHLVTCLKDLLHMMQEVHPSARVKVSK